MERPKSGRMEINMKNIIICIPSLEYGGAERVTVRLAKEFSKKYNDTIITMHSAVNEYSLDKKVGRINLSKKNIIQKSLEFRNIIKEKKPEFLIVMFAPMYVFVHYSLVGLNIPKIVSERNDPNNFAGKKIVKLLYQYTLSKADGAVFQTKQARDYYLNKYNIKNRIIYNPISIDELPLYYEEIRKKTIVNVGRLHEQKNQLLLIESIIAIHDQIPEYELLIYGEGELREELQSHINKANAQNYIKLVGKSNKVLELINDASLFVLSSNFEGMPNVLIEAMCLGMPVISTDCPCGGPAELIENGVNGILVDVGNKEQLSNAILKIIKNSQMSKKLGQNAKELQRTLNLEEIAKQWLEFCCEIREGLEK